MTKKAKTTEPAHSLLFAPATLSASAPPVPPLRLLEKITYAFDNEFNARQRLAFERAFNERVSLVWGPPGTGKTTVLAGIILGRLAQAEIEGKPVRICIGASNYNAIDNVLNEIVELCEKFENNLKTGVRIVRVRSPHAAPPASDKFEDVVRGADAANTLAQALNKPENSWIIGGTNRQLEKLAQNLSENGKAHAKWFDLLAIDEASQMPVASAAAYFLLLRENANIVLAGDHWQLGPIYNFEMRDSTESEGLLDCIFTFLQTKHGVTRTALNENYRNNGLIAEWSKRRFYKEGFVARNAERRLQISVVGRNEPSGWTDKLNWTDDYRKILDSNSPVAVITYNVGNYTVSNPFETQAVAALAWFYRGLLLEQCGGAFDEADFWKERLGIITPHRAQMAAIRNKLAEVGLPMQPPPIIDTVDRFQGLERDFVIASYAVADADFIRSEENFILNPRRFNVTLTRPRSKFVMFVSQSLIHHLPSDVETAREAAHLQLFVTEYCSEAQTIWLPFFDGQKQTSINCQLRIPKL